MVIMLRRHGAAGWYGARGRKGKGREHRAGRRSGPGRLWRAMVAGLSCLAMTGGMMAAAATAGAVTPAEAMTTPRSNTVVDGHARFEVLTPTLIRLEYAGDNHFQDGTTINVVNRNFPVPAYTTGVQNGWRVIRTGKLTLRYKEGSGPFTPQNTSVTLTVAGRQVTAHPSWQTRVCVFGQVCQAEDATLSGGASVASDHQNYTGTGFVAGYENVGAQAGFSTSAVPGDGTYTLHIRYANYPQQSADGGKCMPRQLSVYVNGKDTATATFGSTGSWDNWAVAEIPVSLTKGSDEIALTRDPGDCGNINIDSIAVTQAGQPMPPAPPPPSSQGSLGGWRRSLDGQSGPAPLSTGMLNRNGWYLLDDSQTALWTKNGWAEPRPGHGGAPYQDGYFFGYGHHYKTALQEFAHLTGPAPLLPKAQFGFQYSRYYPYSATDYEQTLIPEFRSQRVPLDVLYIDTDWKAPSSWNGWNWNKTLFPDPAKFLAWAHAQGLHVALNIHPSIQSSDPRFPEASKIAGGLVNNGGGNYVWDWSNPSQAKSYIWLHQKLEKQGVDFWWLDWCCDASYVSMKGLTPDTWINYLYARDRVTKGKRGFVFSRMGSALYSYTGSPVFPSGPWAAHRYDVHFTGDTYSTWSTLAFEALFTQAEGASVGLPYVGDDLGGFHGSHLPDDLYARWMQLGAFQPIMRVHSDHGDRLPWKYGSAARKSAEKFIRLREALVPYTYTTARQAHDTGLPMLRALYLDYPGQANAYKFDHEYMYGSQMLVAPITTPGKVASRKVWFPAGTWIDYFTGARYTGPSVQTVTVPLDRMPVYVKAGGIVPEQPYMDHVGANPHAATILKVYSGADGSYRLYDDAGAGLGYMHGQYAWTTIRHTQNGNGQQVLTIGAAQGSYPGQSATRRFRAQFADTSKPAQVHAGHRRLPEVEAGSDSAGWWYDTAAHTVHVNLPVTGTGQAIQVALEGTHVVNPPQQPVASVTLQAPSLTTGQPSTVKAAITNYGPGTIQGTTADLKTPAGWKVQPSPAVSIGDLAQGASATATWQVTPPASAEPLSQATLTADTSYSYGSPAQQGSAADQQTVYVQNPVRAPYKAYASASPAYFGQSGNKLAIATSGEDVWTGTDQYGAIYQPGAAGQHSTAVVKVDSQDNTSPWAKAGIMMRDDITKAGSSAGYAMISVTPGNGIAFQWDSNGDGFLDGDVNTGTGTASAPVWLKLVRNGSTFTGYYSTDGSTWHKVASATVPGTQSSEDAGVFMSAHASGSVGQASFSGFTITSP